MSRPRISPLTLPNDLPAQVARPLNPAGEYLLSIDDAAVYLSLSDETIRLEIRAGRIRTKRYGKRVLIPRVELERFADSLPDGERDGRAVA